MPHPDMEDFRLEDLAVFLDFAELFFLAIVPSFFRGPLNDT